MSKVGRFLKVVGARRRARTAGSVPCRLVGGPFDGKRLNWPGEPGERIVLPWKEGFDCVYRPAGGVEERRFEFRYAEADPRFVREPL